MSVKKYFYVTTRRNNQIMENNSFEEEEIGNDEDDDYGTIHYSSSSSISSSIPWAETTIKQNQIEWDQLEQQLQDEEALPEISELRQEILEWQQKFPLLLKKREVAYKGDKAPLNDKNSKNMESLSIISFTSQDNDETETDYGLYEKFGKHSHLGKNGTAPYFRRQNYGHEMERMKTSTSDVRESLADSIERNLNISSVPVNIRCRHNDNTNRRTYVQRQAESVARESRSSSANSANNSLKFCTSSLSSDKKPNSALTKNIYSHINFAQDKLRTNSKNKTIRGNTQMPPILNVLECKRSFLALPNTRNRSFVQLTSVPQQAKSAAVLSRETSSGLVDKQQQQQKLRRNLNRSTWYVPFVAASMDKRYQNNRNTIILPSLNASSSIGNSNNPFRHQHQRVYLTQAEYRDLTNTTSGTDPSTSRSISSAAATLPHTQYIAHYIN